jgi:tetratricopeptide (TPR) repeat protein
MVTGRLPFGGKTSTDILSAIIRDEPVPASQHNADVPPKLEEIISECLEKDPADRYLHADQLAADLRKLKRTSDSGVERVRTPSGAVGVAPSSGWTRLIGTGTRRTALMAALIVLLVAGGIATWWATRTAPAFKLGDRIFVADFENATDRPEIDLALRDIFEFMLAQSTFIDVLRGEQLQALLVDRTGSAKSRIDRTLAERLCVDEECAGFATGRMWQDGSGYNLEVSLQHCGSDAATISRSSGPHTEEELLDAVHHLVLGIHQALGQKPEVLIDYWGGATRSLRAYQAFAASRQTPWPEEKLALLRKALEIDPNFVQAYYYLAIQLWNLGDFGGFRETLAEAYVRSSSLPEWPRLKLEIAFLESNYDLDAAMERMRAAARLYPNQYVPQQGLCLFYPDGYQDLDLHMAACEAAYRLGSNYVNLGNLCGTLFALGDADEIERVTADFRAKGGSEVVSDSNLLLAHMLRGEEAKVKALVERLRGVTASLNAEVSSSYLTWFLRTGRLKEAREVASEAWRAAKESGELDYLPGAELAQSWLAMRRGDEILPLRREGLKSVEGDLRYLAMFAMFSVELKMPEPLGRLIEVHKLAEKGSKSRFVSEELEFARACLAVTHDDVNTARTILEPLTRDSGLARRHWVLGRVYEELGLVREAAGEYEEVFRTAAQWQNLDIASVRVLTGYRLAQIYERLGNTGRARHWYESFLTDWKDADPDIPELIEAKKRMVVLSENSSEGED